MINTVNVIHFSEPMQIKSFASWEESDGGNDSAELCFIKLIKENTQLTDDEIDERLDDGYVEFGNQTVILVHSTEVDA